MDLQAVMRRMYDGMTDHEEAMNLLAEAVTGAESSPRSIEVLRALQSLLRQFLEQHYQMEQEIDGQPEEMVEC